MAMKNHEISISTALSVDQIKVALQGPLARAEMKPLSSATGGFLDTGPTAAVEFLAQKKALNGFAAVQVYIFDGVQRKVVLVALGDSGFSRAMGGTKNTTSLGKSIKLAEQLAEAVQR